MVVAGSLYFLTNIFDSVSSVQFEESDIIQYVPFILKFDSSNQGIVGQFSEFPFEMPKYSNCFLVKYNLLSDLYVFKSEQLVSEYINMISKTSTDIKITKSWLNGFQVFQVKFQIKAGFTYYVTGWRDYIFVSNNPDALKTLFDRIVQGLRVTDQNLPTTLFSDDYKNIGFVNSQGQDIFEKYLTIPFINFNYPLTFYPSDAVIDIYTGTSKVSAANNLQIFDFNETLFEIASNDSDNLKQLLQNNFLSVLSKTNNMPLDKVFAENLPFSELVLFNNNMLGLVLYSESANSLLANLQNDFKNSTEIYKGVLILRIGTGGKNLYVATYKNLILLFEDRQEILDILDGKIDTKTCMCNLYLKFNKGFNNVASIYNVPKIISPFEDFSVSVAYEDSMTKIKINKEK